MLKISCAGCLGLPPVISAQLILKMCVTECVLQRQNRQLSLAIPPWVSAMSTSESWGVNRHTARCTSPVSSGLAV